MNCMCIRELSANSNGAGRARGFVRSLKIVKRHHCLGFVGFQKGVGQGFKLLFIDFLFILKISG